MPCPALTAIHRYMQKSCVMGAPCGQSARPARDNGYSECVSGGPRCTRCPEEGRGFSHFPGGRPRSGKNMVLFASCEASLPFVLIASSLRLLSSAQRSGRNRDCAHGFAFRSYSAVSAHPSMADEYTGRLGVLCSIAMPPSPPWFSLTILLPFQSSLRSLARSIPVILVVLISCSIL